MGPLHRPLLLRGPLGTALRHAHQETWPGIKAIPLCPGRVLRAEGWASPLARPAGTLNRLRLTLNPTSLHRTTSHWG